jgi:hypothetical protein
VAVDPAVQAEAAEEIRRRLGIEPTSDALLERLLKQIGQAELAIALTVIRSARPDRIIYSMGALAAASLAMDYLGTGWWSEPRVRDGIAVPADVRSPAELLRDNDTALQGAGSRPATQLLGSWAESDISDHLWGKPVAWIDGHMSQRNIDKVVLPPYAQPDDILLLAWDSGQRVRAQVAARSDATLTLTILRDELEAPGEDVWWSWVTAAKDDPPYRARTETQ